MTNYEHLPLPKVENELPRRPRRGSAKEKRSDRSSHGSLLLTQVSSLSKDIEEKEHLGINPKLIFKIKVRKNDSLENHLPSLGLNLLAKEPKAKQAIVVFADDNQLVEFKKRLKSYAGTVGGPEYGYLDDIEELVPLEPKDRMGPLLIPSQKLIYTTKFNYKSKDKFLKESEFRIFLKNTQIVF